MELVWPTGTVSLHEAFLLVLLVLSAQHPKAVKRGIRLMVVTS